MVFLTLSSNSISIECILKIRKVNMELCNIWTNILEMVHAMTNVSMKYIYEVICDLSVYIMTINLGLRLGFD